MSSDFGLAAASLLLTYVLRTSAVYALLSLSFICVRNCRIRSRLNGLFLAAAAGSWLCILFSSALPATRPEGRIVSSLVYSRQFSWLVDSATLPQVVKGLTLALWLYAVILTVLLLRFCAQSWRLRSLLRGSERPPGGLALLFELVRSRTRSPGCELRLLDDLHSPATTGWRTPFVLIPRDLVPRLDRTQLVNVFQHELMHVRRRDYLWDRLSTLACYLIFFHPAAWWARRGLRWERELVCDESVVLSGEGRVEYASCLTTLAAWRSFQNNAAGHVDFLSPSSSLLAARVRALLAEPRKYGPGKEIAFTVLTMGALTASAVLVPTVGVVAYSAPHLHVIVSQMISPHTRSAPRYARSTHRSGHQDGAPPALLPAAPRPVSPPLEWNVNALMPTLSPPEGRSPDTSEDGDSQVAEATEASYPPSRGEYSPPSNLIWDESLPRPPRRRASKVGRLALSAVQAGIVAAVIGLREHDKAH